ncbi:hypothetical protein Sru01_08830 [Sphaerisporangium rufum]|uniref:Terpene synthase n=1 Tax=Sphaerisporangium rufum TaxID=1381558 RepID=A0A919R004_9ACTN|nr:terpene synthase family protein [Sphaerisporangium rufum]GII75901.1 hypothetical protein Sru01_08830 [Sphaerisporangium rufum]
MTAVEAEAHPAALPSGAICAVAGRSQRQMAEWTAAYPSLFAAPPFDAALYATVSMAMAFSGPWLTADELRMANKATLWAFALDWLVDHEHRSPAEARALVDGCLAVAAGAAPAAGDELARMLADIRDELAAAPAFAELGGMWREELRRTLTAMLREWEWKAAGLTPSLDDYLGNADNHGFCFVFACHWIATGGPAAAGRDRVIAASRAVQLVMRLLNDVSSYRRDLEWGDLNALLLDVPREEVTRRITDHGARTRALLAEARQAQPRLADYLERQLDFCAGFYRTGEYWGAR